jgi:hypothetical protein
MMKRINNNKIYNEVLLLFPVEVCIQKSKYSLRSFVYLFFQYFCHSIINIFSFFFLEISFLWSYV